jgi:molybdopterin molybdotransferase
MTDQLVSVDTHLSDILASVDPLEAIRVQLLDAHGCVLAQDVDAIEAQPRFDNSSMDGYAVRCADVAAASPDVPVWLPVVGDIAAGSGKSYRVEPGLSMRIMTGAPMPEGADAVIPLEWTDGGLAKVEIRRAPSPGDHVRRAGEEISPGMRVLDAGTFLGAPQIGLLSAVGHAQISIRPRPRVVIISTGSELAEPGTELGPGQIPDANSYTLTAAAREAGAVAYRVGIVPDDPRRLLEVLEEQLIRADVVVTSGGVSVGAYDVVKEALAGLGTVDFRRVAMQPGMPQGFGVIGPDRTPFFGLPGNPVSAFVSFEVFVRPALRRLLGAENVHRPIVPAVTTQPLTSPLGKRQFLRARMHPGPGRLSVTPVGGAGSHLIGSLAKANALMIIEEDVTEVPAGGSVQVMVLERRGG